MQYLYMTLINERYTITNAVNTFALETYESIFINLCHIILKLSIHSITISTQ